MTPTTEALEKLIADNRWRDIEEAPALTIVQVLTKEGDNAYCSKSEAGLWLSRGGREATHFRPLPDNRIADVCRVLVGQMVHFSRVLDDPNHKQEAIEALEKANAIATGEPHAG